MCVIDVILVFLLLTLHTYFTPLFSVSFVKLEQVNGSFINVDLILGTLSEIYDGTFNCVNI